MTLTDTAPAENRLSTWKFSGLDQRTGARRRGSVMAHTEDGAQRAARRQGLMGVKVSAVSSKSGMQIGSGVKRGSASERVSFLRSLALINSAVPNVNQALEIAARQVKPKSALRPAVASLLEATSTAGVTLADAFAAQSHIWGEDVAAVVAAGIESGNLTDALKTLAQHKLRSARINKKVRKTFTKPFMTITMTFILLWVAMTKVIPDAVEFAVDLNVELPGVTQWALSAGEFLDVWALPFSLVATALFVGLYFASQSPIYGVHVANFVLNLPFVGRIIHGQAITLAAGVMAIGLTADASTWQVAEWATDAVNNKRVKQSLRSVHERIIAGDSFGDAMDAQIPVVPYEVAALARQSSLGLEDNGSHWRAYAEEISEITEERVDSLSDAVSVVINMVMITAVTYISIAATAPALSVLVTVIENPSGIT